MYPSQVVEEYTNMFAGGYMTQHDRKQIWEEYCRRTHQAEASGWLRVLVVLGLVAAFFAGFAVAAVELVP